MFTKPLLLGALLGAVLLPPLVAQEVVAPDHWRRSTTSSLVDQAVTEQPDRVTLEGFFTNGFLPVGAGEGLRDDQGNLLDGGTTANGDGFVLQFGYFSTVAAGTSPLAFTADDWASFTPLTSDGGAAHRITTIGDTGGPPGQTGLFSINITLKLDTATETFDSDVLPNPGGYRLGIRFFNADSVSGATFFNTVTGDLAGWDLPNPSNPPATTVFMNMDDDPLFWESTALGLGASAEWATSLDIALMPEPSTSLLAILGFGSLLIRRRRTGT